jgi:hypothetical protein
VPEPSPDLTRPPGGPRPPAPPGTTGPSRQPDPADPGPPIPVVLGPLQLGDLGNTLVDVRLLNAILLRGGRVAEWLRSEGIDLDKVDTKFPGGGW